MYVYVLNYFLSQLNPVLQTLPKQLDPEQNNIWPEDQIIVQGIFGRKHYLVENKREVNMRPVEKAQFSEEIYESDLEFQALRDAYTFSAGIK